MDRQKKSFLNISSNFLILLTNTLLSFAVRTVFIKVLGEQYLGVNGLFTNILQVISLAELGIGTAINYALYDPLAKKDYKKVSIIMRFYKKVYETIGTIILIAGLAIIPFLDVMMKDNNVPHTVIIYLLYLFNTVAMYFISYKETLIIADQRYYKLTKIIFSSNVLIYISQIVILITFKSFIIYLLAQILITFIQRVLCNRLITNDYRNNVDFKCKEKISKDELSKITTNVKAMFFHKIGYNIVQGTDNIIISSFINVATVGIYGNYLSLTTMINTLLYSIFTSITSSFGNLAVLEDSDKQENVFNILNFLAFVVFGFATLCFAFLLEPFVTLWIGEKYVLPMQIVLVICINFYINGIKAPLDTVKEASGIYKQDQYVPLCQAGLNIIFSVIFVNLWGLIGVLLGTLVSSLAMPFWNRPYTVYKYAFHKSCMSYFKDAFMKIIIIFISYIIIFFISSNLAIESLILTVAVRLIICFVVFTSIVISCYRNTDSFKFYADFIKKKLKR